MISLRSMRRPHGLNECRQGDHGIRVVATCMGYVENLIDNGYSVTSAIQSCVDKFNIAKTNIWRWWKVYFNYGEIHIVLNIRMKMLRKKYGVARRTLSENHLYELKRIVIEHPEFYLDEFVAELARITGVYYHPSTISRLIRRRLGYTLQVLQEIAIQRDEILRKAYNDALHQLLSVKSDPRVVVFIDETHKDRNSSRRRRGWGPRNSNNFSVRRWFRDEVRYTMIVAADISGFIPETCLNYYRDEKGREGASGTVGKEDFESWIEHYLVPILGRYDKNENRSVAVMDNASTHMGDRVRDLIEDAGAYLLYTAPYSPDLNPIEKMFHLYKKYLQRHEHRYICNHVEVHWEALNESVNSDIAINEFRKCGVPFSDIVKTQQELELMYRQIISIILISDI